VSEAQDDAPDAILDTRGLLCPLPVVKTRERITTLPPGSRLDVLADDPLVRLDMQAFCARDGHVYLGARDLGGGAWRMALRTADGGAPA
jgi:tRNA 2-thiouridine synthesizing protein A